jgi:uncharacterized protein involved in exopolysaccharide biosynthesis
MITVRTKDAPNEPMHDLVTRAPVDDRGDMVSMLTLLNVVLRQRALIYTCAAVLFIAAAIQGLLTARTYTSRASFMPQATRSGSGIGALAAQFGVNVGTTSPDGLSPEFYVGLIRSRTVLGAVVDSSYQLSFDSGSKGNLVRAFEITLADRAKARERAIEKLDAAIEANAVQKTGLVQLSVETKSPTLSFQIARRLIDEVNRFNQQTRRSQAVAERQFTERRLNEVRGELRDAEDSIQAFENANRQFRSSPELNSRYERLNREVGRRSGLYLEVSQAYERARIEEVRDTPVISMVDRPETAVLPNPRGMVSKSLIALIAGGVLGVFIAFAREFFRRTPRPMDEEAEFIALTREAASDLLHPWRPLARRFRRRVPA